MRDSSYGYKKLRTAKDLLGKMDREFLRMRRDKKWQSHHAFNFAVTAWHITDWVYKDARQRHSSNKSPFGCRNLKSFQQFVRSDCPALDICYDLAIGSKHMEVSRPTRKVAKTDVSAVASAPLGGFILGSDRLGGVALKVRLADGTSSYALDVFALIAIMYDMNGLWDD